MNPSNPTTTEMRQIETIFFEQMKQQTRKVTDPVLMARLRRQAPNRRDARINRYLLNSFDFQFSDQWVA